MQKTHDIPNIPEKKKEQIWRNYTSQFQNLLEKVTVINRTNIPEINPYIYVQLIFNKGTKKIQWENNYTVNKWC